MSRRLRIGLVGPAHSIHVRRWALFLAGRGHAVHVFTERPPDEPLPGIRIHAWPLRRAPRLLRLVAAIPTWFALQFVLRIQVTNVQSLGSNLPFALVTARGALVLVPWGGDVLRASGRLRGALLARALRRAALILTTSLEMRGAVLDRLGGRRVPIETVSWGVDPVRFRPADDDERCRLRAQLGLPAEATVLVAPRSITPAFHVLEIVRAFETAATRRPDLRLVLIGGSVPVGRAATRRTLAYRDEVRRASARLADRVRFLDRLVSEDEMAAVLRSADLALSLAEADQRSSSVLEALACGVPVIGTNIGAYREMAANGFALRLVEGPLERALVEVCSGAARIPADARRRVSDALAGREDREAQFTRLARRLEALAGAPRP